MNLKKISFIGLTSFALLFTACGGRKEVKFDVVCKHITEHYTGTDKRTPTEVKIKFKGSANDEESKNAVKDIANTFGVTLNDKLEGEKLMPEKMVAVSVCKTTDIPTTGAKYYISGKELTWETEIKTQALGVEMVETISITYDAEGYIKLSSTKGNYKSASINCTFEAAYHYTYAAK